MIDKIVRIGPGPSDLMRIERHTPDKRTFYGTACRGGHTSAPDKLLALPTPEDLQTWEFWAEVRNGNAPK